jgi:biotin carboxylase
VAIGDLLAIEDCGLVRRVLLLSATTGYQLRAFGEAAERTGIEIVFATDRCQQIDDPWRDAAIPVRFHEESRSVAAIADAASARPLHGVLAVGDRPTVLAARAAARLNLPGNPPEAARASANKLLARERFAAAGLPVPWFFRVPAEVEPSAALRALECSAATPPFPCVVKPLTLSGSRGVIRADDAGGFVEAIARVQRLLRRKEVRALRDEGADAIVVEGFIAGSEFALEGVVQQGTLQPLAVFDKPDPLDGPFFEETIYCTPSRLDHAAQSALVQAIATAVRALGLCHGPVHAECRVAPDGRVFVLEVAARPIGGLCARVLRFDPGPITLEELLLRQAVGEPVESYRRERPAAAVMMIPIPRRGMLKGTEGLEEAGAIDGIEEIAITARQDQVLEPLPEGASYLGFIFARAAAPHEAVAALREAHARLRFRIDPAYPLLRSGT